jgi:chemotaxis protein MotB
MIGEEEVPAGAPEWLTTYGDLMSLLLTFFVMLASMSELKDTDTFHGVADSLQDRFGYDPATGEPLAGGYQPRNSLFAGLIRAPRSQRAAALKQPATDRFAERPQSPGRLLRPGDRTTAGAVLYFHGDTTELSTENQSALWQLADLVQGKPQKIEIRAHAVPDSAVTGEPADRWQEPYARAQAVMQFMVQDLAIEPQRIRLSVAGPYEPLHLGAAADPQQKNPRVEIFLLDELASDLAGTAEERNRRYKTQTK